MDGNGVSEDGTDGGGKGTGGGGGDGQVSKDASGRDTSSVLGATVFKAVDFLGFFGRTAFRSLAFLSAIAFVAVFSSSLNIESIRGHWRLGMLVPTAALRVDVSWNSLTKSTALQRLRKNMAGRC